jgi:hypothetical protein
MSHKYTHHSNKHHTNITLTCVQIFIISIRHTDRTPGIIQHSTSISSPSHPVPPELLSPPRSTDDRQKSKSTHYHGRLLCAPTALPLTSCTVPDTPSTLQYAHFTTTSTPLHHALLQHSPVLVQLYSLYISCIIGVLQYLYCTRLLRVQQQCTPCSV